MSIEKALVEALEPLVTEVSQLKSKVAEIETKEQVIPEVDFSGVINEVVEKVIPLIPTAKDGQDGEQGPQGEQGPEGKPGKDAEAVEVSIDDVAKALKEDSEFVQIVKPVVDPADVASKLFTEYGAQLVGPGIEVDAWEDKVYREGSYVSHNLGQLFKAVRDTASNPNDSDDWVRVNNSGFRFCGAYDASKSYREGDTYINDYSWFAWLGGKSVCIGGRGAKGEKGIQGAQGPAGRDGLNGKDIIAFEARGYQIALVTRASNDLLEEYLVDLAPAIEKQFELLTSHVSANMEDIAKSITESVTVTHPSDPDATPLRFFRGNWYATDSYSTGDVIIYASKLFVAVKDTPPGNLPGGNKSLLDAFVDDQYWRTVHAGGGGGGGESLQMGLLNALQDQVNAIQVGLLHQVAVQDIIDIPPTTPKEGDRYIVGVAPVGAFEFHANEVAFYGSTGWEFTIPKVGNAHYVNATQKSVVWNGQHWVQLPRQAKVSLQADAPLDPNPGDTWLDNAGSKLEVKYFDGTSWITSSGTRTFSQQADPQLANTMKDGDVWVQTFPQDATTGVTPPPITKVWTAGSWSTTTPSIPASSRTYMQSEVPTAGARGDTWIDLASGKPLVKYYDGLSWIDSGGTRTFSQNTDPRHDTPPKVVNEGDLWSDATDPKAVKIYQWTAGKWVQVNAGGGIFIPEAPPSLIKGVWYKKFTPATTPNVPVTNPGMWASYGANDVSFTTGNISTNCPVPSKYRTAQDHFKITVSYKTTQRCNGEIWERFYFEHNGAYNIVSKDIRMETDIPTGFAQFYCYGNSQAMQWIIVRLLGRNGGTLPTSLSFFSEVEVQWELLSI